MPETLAHWRLLLVEVVIGGGCIVIKIMLIYIKFSFDFLGLDNVYNNISFKIPPPPTPPKARALGPTQFDNNSILSKYKLK